MRFRILLHDLRSSFWFRPLLWVLLLGGSALSLLWIDQQFARQGREVTFLNSLFGGVDGTRDLLAAISTAALTIATLIFSIIMVAVVQTANAYSPRLLDEYLSDSKNQHVMGIFLGTFVYALLVLQHVRATDNGAYLPPLALTGALVLAVVSILTFVYFINHVAHSIEVSHIVVRLKRDGKKIIETGFPSEVGQPWPPGTALPPLPGTGTIVTSAKEGYVEGILAGELLQRAARDDVLLRLEVKVGEYVLPGMPLASVWPESKAESFSADVIECVVLGDERTLFQDLHFALQQLSDIALRALSPAINDPTTASNCLDVIAALLVEVLERPVHSPYRCDDEGRLRVIVQGDTLASLTEVAFNQILHYGRSDVVCLSRMLDICRQLGALAQRAEDRDVLWEHVTRVALTAENGVAQTWHRMTINRHLTVAAAVLQRDPEPYLLPTAPANIIHSV